MRNKLILLFTFVLLASPAWGATQLKKTVKPSGGDYTSLESCMNANEQDLVTADKYFDVEIDGTWSSADTTAVTIHNYTTDATRYINIYTTGDARHTGVYSTIKYRVGPISYGTALSIGVQYVTIDGLQILGNTNGDGISVFSNSVFKNNIIVNLNPNNKTGVLIGSSQSTNLINNIIYGWESGIYEYYCNASSFYSNTLGNNTKGFGDGQSIPASIYKNNIAYNNTTDYTNTASYGAASTHNLSKDATAPALNTYYRSKTLTFTNTTAGSEDFHLVSGDTDAIDKGTDTSGESAPLNLTTDIDGTTRSGTWDIGADEYAAANSQVIIVEEE